MKKILGISLIVGFMCCSFSYAVAPVLWKSSQTATADTTQPLCGQFLSGTSTVTYHAILYNVCISSPVTGSAVTLYNSSYTATTNGTGYISAANEGCLTFNTVYPKGLMYTTTGSANIIIGYDCY